MRTIKPTKTQFKIALVALSILSVSGYSNAEQAPRPAPQEVAQPAAPQEVAQPQQPASDTRGTEVHVGGNLGGGWQQNSGGTPAPGPLSNGFPPEAITALGSVAQPNDTTSFAGQALVGVSMDTGWVSVGADVVLTAGVKKDSRDQVTTNGDLTLTSTNNGGISEIGEIRGVLTIEPIPNVSLAVFGGPAVGWGTYTNSQTFSSGGQVLHTNTTTFNDSQWGGSFGGSLGYDVSDRVTVLVGYEHYWFGGEAGESGAFTPEGSLVPGTNITTHYKPQFGFASVGLMYKWPVGAQSAPKAGGVYK